jgi:eukaryotic-like serine/threonine-protein kinase
MLGTMLGHYRLLSELGRGGTATVYLAEDIHLHRQVAVKVFEPNPQASNTAEFLAHFTREARVLARLDHPHILPVYEYGEQGTYAYLVMPYMPGGSPVYPSNS